MSRPTQSACGTLVNTGVVLHADQAQVGYLSIGPPLCYTYEPTPKAYTSGINAKGKMIGRNSKVPYPGELPKYHHLPFLRNVDWAGGADANTTDPTPEFLRISECPDSYDSPQAKGSGEIDEYFTADNDEGYEKWRVRKDTTCEAEVMDKGKGQESPKDCWQSAPKKRKLESYTSHYMPVLFQTTNQTYGSYQDLESNYYTNFRASQNGSGMRVPFKVNALRRKTVEKDDDINIPATLGYLNAKTSSKTTFMTSYNHPDKMNLLGLRSRCHSFHVYSPTGLEMNRIPLTNRSLFSSMAQQIMRNQRRTRLEKIVPTQTIRLSIPHCPSSNRGMFKTPVGYMCLEKKDCF